VTDIAFHFNVGQATGDKLTYACRLLRKAVAAGARVAVVGDADVLAQLDRLIWTFSPLEFIAHCTAGHPDATPHMVSLSPVILSEESEHYAHRDVMLNLLAQVPSGFSPFRRVIEIVSLDEADRLQARSRWKRYTELGFTITRHDIALQGA
jgi:DNA polymerase-3 subunit chi